MQEQGMGDTHADRALADLLTLAATGMDEALAFSQAQLPVVAEQLIRWKLFVSISTNLLAVVGLVLVYLLWRRATRKQGWYARIVGDNEAADGCQLVGLLGLTGALCVSSMWLIVWSLHSFNVEFIQLLMAPKLYLLEYAADLLRARPAGYP